MMPASVLLATTHIEPYRPVVRGADDPNESTGSYIDLGRLIIVLYIMTLQFRIEIKYELKRENSWWSYFLTFSGLADLGVIVAYLYIFITRNLLQGYFGDLNTHLADTWP